MKHLTKAGAAFFASALIISVLMITPAIAIEIEEIRIGYTAPLTGAAAEFGNNGWCGIQLALEEINKKGISIGGKLHKIRIFKYDSGCLPDEGVSNVHKMITEDKVIAILGDHCSTVCNVVAPLCDQYQVPGITIECGADNVTNPGHEFYFRMRPTIKMMIPSVMPKVFKTFDVRTAAFFVVNDEYGKNHIESIKNELDWRDVKIVAQETFERESNEFLPQLERIHRTTPDLLFYVGTGAFDHSATPPVGLGYRRRRDSEASQKVRYDAAYQVHRFGGNGRDGTVIEGRPGYRGGNLCDFIMGKGSS